MAYVLDSDVFIQAQNMHYPFTVCPGFWAWLDAAHSISKLFSIKVVRNELLALEDDLSKWVKPRSKMFIDTSDATTYESLKLLSSWAAAKYAPAAQSEFFAAADFFLVGYAHAHNHVVVTHEVFALGFRVKIPVACKAMDVECITPFEMLRREGPRFTLDSN